jgi:UDP-glucose 4-epimerase
LESSKHNVLVTGGAGYIGSHCVRGLLDRDYRVVVIDDFRTGNRWAVPEGVPLVECDVGNEDLVRQTIRTHGVGSVLHFAGHTVVPESIFDPLKYYGNNTCSTRSLIASCRQEGVNRFVFSSTAAVYGAPSDATVSESTAPVPINPYGSSKLVTEWMLRDVAQSSRLSLDTGRGGEPFRPIILRYFNVAGAREDGTLGQSTPNATHLIKIASQAACGSRSRVSIFGTDYDTPDGTCIRDYIHVEDLVDAHLAALDHLERGGDGGTYNCGYGRGYSVREVLDTMRRVSGAPILADEEGRRPGDPSALIADVSAIRRDLGWTPTRDDLDLICTSAWRWEQQLLRRGY